MPTFEEYESERFISFKENKTQRIVWPGQRTTVRMNEKGQYPGPQVLVKQNGKDAWLNIKSKRLEEQLRNFPSQATLDITQAGSGTATTYKVEPVKK